MGALQEIALARPDGSTPGALVRVAREKRWVYVLVASEEALFALAVVRTGYGASAFGWLHRRGERVLVADRTALGPTFSGHVARSFHVDDPARYRGPGGVARLRRPRPEVLEVEGRLGELAFELSLDAHAAPEPVSAVVRTDDGFPLATEKQGPLAASGTVRAGGRAFSFASGLAGTDFSVGMPPRHTRWRWGMVLGRDTQGRALCVNLVEGHVGAPECAIFTEGRASALPEPRVTFQRDVPGAPWRFDAPGVELACAPEALHVQRRRLGPVQVRLAQGAGVYAGRVEGASGTHVIAGALGVVEDQDSLW